MNAEVPKADICGFPISTGGLDDNFAIIKEHIRKGRGMWVVTLNLEMIYRVHRYPAYRTLLSEADFFIADGVPLLWASDIKKHTPKIKGRSNGTDLVEELLQSDINYRLGVVGSKNPSAVVEMFNPSLLKGAYFYDGIIDLKDEELIESLISDLQKHKINLLFLPLGVPKQDQLAHKIRREIDYITIIGVGGAFDLLAGNKTRAPKWMQRNGLEWFHRLISEPARLWKRYLIHYPQAVFYLLRDIFGTFNRNKDNSL